jgi:ubiquinol-cytochrome c reductase cytochrome b subunit
LRITKYHFSFYLPRLAFASLLLCMVSGIVLAFHYRPFGNVFESVEEITTVIPYGFFFRGLHYASGQIFAILTLLHVLDYFLRRRYRTYSLWKWLLLTSPVYISFFLLFTGFILKGDKEGLLAGNILLNMTKDIPFIGDSISHLLIRPGDSFYFLPYLHHCLFLPPVLIFLLYDHIQAWLPKRKFILLTASILFTYSLLVKMPVDIPPQADFSPVKGPWFFLGIQESLRIIPALMAGIVIPWSFFLLFSLLPLIKGFWEALIRYCVIISSLFYAILSIAAYFFMEYSWRIF